MKFKIEEKEEYIFRNIRFSKELFDEINRVKGKNTFTKFVIEAIKFAIDNMEEWSSFFFTLFLNIIFILFVFCLLSCIIFRYEV